MKKTLRNQSWFTEREFLRERENSPGEGSSSSPLPLFPPPLFPIFLLCLPPNPLVPHSFGLPLSSSPLLSWLRYGRDALLKKKSSLTLPIIFGLQRPKSRVLGLDTGSYTETLVGFGSGGCFLSIPTTTIKPS